jgi:hypothetical protein
MIRILSALTIALALAAAASADDTASLVRRIKSVGPEGAGNADAVGAWKELSRLGPNALPQMLVAFDGASPTAANWLRAAVDCVAERARNEKRALPCAAVEAFLRDTRHVGKARRLAYELLRSADATAPQRLLPTFLNDPGPELRYEAVAVAFAAAKQQPKESAAAKDALRQLLTTAREPGQVEEIARELEQRGEVVDLVTVFGFVTRWHIVGPFDNTDGKGLQAAYPPEQGVDLRAKYRGKDGREIAWGPHTTTDKGGSVDLNKVLGKLKNTVAYGYVVVESPEEQPVEVRAASATAVKIFVNGREIFTRDAYHQSYDHDMHSAATRLTRGRNTIIIKVCQNDQTEDWAQNWMFRVRVTDALGTPVPLSVVEPAAKGPR